MRRSTVSERALVFAPHGRDAVLAAQILHEAGLGATPCRSLSELIGGLDKGAAFAIVTEEAISTADLNPLAAWLAEQEEWSDFPFVLLTRGGGGLERNPAAARHLDVLGNVTFLERPFHPTTLVSLARSALRARKRQYEARARMVDLRDSETRFRTLFQAMDEGFCVIQFIDGPQGRMSDYIHIQANAAYEANAGIPNIVGKRLREIVSPSEADAWAEIYRGVLISGEPIRFERELIETSRHLELGAFRIESEIGQVAVIFKDVTERKTAENQLRVLNETLEQRVLEAVAERERSDAQLREAQKLETLGQLTGGVAHDINNLLTPITGTLDLLSRRMGSADQRSARLIEGALQSAGRAQVLVSRLLGFARRQALETRPIDIAALLDGMRDLLASSIGPVIEIRYAVEPDLPFALADFNQLELALLNLCVNARDAMPEGGTINLAAKRAGSEQAKRAGLGTGSHILLSVIDTGTGMDEATLAHAVEPFYSTKEIGKGTGLGLSMVHGLAGQLGGAFVLSSRLGEGTRADLYLPVAPMAPEAAPVTRGDTADPARSLSLLLVDDDDLVRLATAEMLRDLGHSVEEAADGAQALAVLQSGRRFDAVVTDYMMPRMNGAELSRRIARQSPAMPVLVITGYAGGDLETGTLQLAKPFRQKELAAALDRVLAG